MRAKKKPAVSRLLNLKWRERRDSNPQPPDRQSGTLTKLSYAPTDVVKQLRIIPSRSGFASTKEKNSIQASVLENLELWEVLYVDGPDNVVLGIDDE